MPAFYEAGEAVFSLHVGVLDADGLQAWVRDKFEIRDDADAETAFYCLLCDGALGRRSDVRS